LLVAESNASADAEMLMVVRLLAQLPVLAFDTVD
jgi:hypothetical protein